jgi:hypothetical protein
VRRVDNVLVALSLSVGEECRHGAEDDQAIGEWGDGEAIMGSPRNERPRQLAGLGSKSANTSCRPRRVS